MDNQRHRIILNELDKKGNVTVASLVELTGASESSIRRDLVELDHQGKEFMEVQPLFLR